MLPCLLSEVGPLARVANQTNTGDSRTDLVGTNHIIVGSLEREHDGSVRMDLDRVGADADLALGRQRCQWQDPSRGRCLQRPLLGVGRQQHEQKSIQKAIVGLGKFPVMMLREWQIELHKPVLAD